MLKIKYLILVLPLVLIHQSAFGAIYKCNINGKVTYQEQACKTKNTKQSTIETVKIKKSTKKKISLNFKDIDIRHVFHIIADFSNHILIMDHSINTSSKVFYNKTPWDTVLQDMGRKHKLIIKIENGVIHVSKKT